MAEVFAARLVGPAGFEKDVAVKRVLPRYAKDPVFLQRFLTEARLAARLSHPNIVQIFELGDDGEDHYIVMEAVRGATLRQVCRRLDELGERMPRGVALHIVRAICAGLSHAHEQVGADGQPLHIIHRDVSPQNVLLGHEGSIKLIDFGIAQAAGSGRLTQVGRPLGKPHYMAPEQIVQTSSSPLDARADLFAVGVILHELLTGVRPFEAKTDQELIALIVKGERVPLHRVAPDLEPPLAALLDSALSLRRDDRPRSARAFAADLGAAIELTGHRADAHTLEALLQRLLPDSVSRPWPVNDDRLDAGEHTRTEGVPREITLASNSNPDERTGPAVVSPSTDITRVAPADRRPAAAVVLAGVVAIAVVLAVVLAFGVAWFRSSPPPLIDSGTVPGTVVDAFVISDAGALVDAGMAVAVDGGVVELVIDDVGDVGDVDDADELDEDADAGVRVRPRIRSRVPPKNGRLVVETRPWSEVFVDGRSLGITPLQRDVRAGRHRLKLTNPELGLSKEMKIVVDEKAPTVIRIDLRSIKP